jgi:hypothetical protein
MNALAAARKSPAGRRTVKRRVWSDIYAWLVVVLTAVSFSSLGLQSASAAPAANAAPAELQVVTFRCSGVPQHFSVPPGVASIHVFVQGAAGADPRQRIGSPPAGAAPGFGGVVDAEMPVTQGQLLTVTVGCRTGYGWANGGAGGSANGGVRGGANGGGASGVSLTGSAEPRAVGGGGGGGGGNSVLPTLKGGVGGSAGLTPQDGASGQPVGFAGGVGGPGGGSPTAAGSDGGSATGFPEPGGGGGGGGGGYPLGGRGGQAGTFAGGGSGGGGGGGGGGISFAASDVNPKITTAPTLEDGHVTFIYNGPAAGSQVYGCTGKPVPYVVPPGVTALDVVASGGQGGPPLNAIGSNPDGGRGDVHRGRVAVTPGETLQIVVGCAGGAGTQSWCGGSGGGGGFGLISGGTGGSGAGSCLAPNAGDGGSGGGGASGITSQFPPDDVNDVLLMAAGGGGGGGYTFSQAGGRGGSYGPYKADEKELPQSPGVAGGGACGGSGGGIGSNASILGAVGGAGGEAAFASASGGGGGGGGGFPAGLGGGGGGFAFCGGGGGADGGSRFGLGVTASQVGPYRIFGIGDGMVMVTPIFSAAPQDLTVAATAAAALTRTTTWGIIKGADGARKNIPAGGSATFNYTVQVRHDAGIDGGWTVSGHIAVTNPNDSAVTGVGVTGATDDGGSCTVENGTGVTVPANSSVVVAYACTYAAAPLPSAGTLTATATWPSFGSPNTTATGTAGFDFATAVPTPKDSTVQVTDSLRGLLGTVTSGDPSPTRFSYPASYSGHAGTCTDYPNTASYTADSGKTGSAGQLVTVCVGSDLRVSTTATPSVTPHFDWHITKHVDKSVVKQVGGKATFTYTVVAAESGVSRWQVTGTISVSNPNDWEPITADVTDTVNNGGVCVVTGGAAVSIAAGQTAHLPYVCTYSKAPNPAAGTNTASVTWDKAVAATPTGSALGTHAFVFGAGATGNPAAGDGTVHVTDTFDGATTTLGTATGSKTFTYQRKVAVPASGCRTFANTAAIVETGQTAGAAVHVCGPMHTGALGIGFWHNKNGQAIVSGGHSTAGACDLTGWLREYAPFHDLGGTATCAQVAGYVSRVIGHANAAGPTMNAMLKAQMLATALDTYFSDPTLGGNKIKASAPLGRVTVDLTAVCRKGACTGSFLDARAAFGGAHSLTVDHLLAYAAGQSDAGGTHWYRNVKAVQELAKDTFDAINNQIAFAP